MLDDERIQVTDNGASSSHSQFTVRHDVRFLKYKAHTPTEVTRLSPLRFRKKE
jgi:hypothetical protein